MHCKTRRRLRTAVVTLAASCAATALAPAAHAQLLPLNLNLTVGGLPVGGILNDTQTALSTIPGAATGVLCPPTQDIPGAGTVACNLDLLQYRWHAKFRKPDGTVIDRQIGALLNVPTLLDVDADAAPDLVATLAITGLSPVKLQMQVSRIPLLETGPMPVQLEAVAKDPSKGSLPRQLVSLGVDTRESGLPDTYSSTITVNPSTDLSAELKQDVSGARGPLTLLGTIFNGTPTTPIDTAGFKLRYANVVPSSFGVRGTMGSKLNAELFAAQAGSRLTIGAFLNDRSDHKSGTATIASLPTSAGVEFTPDANDRNTVVYSGSARIPSIQGEYHHTVDGRPAPLEAIKATVTDLPKKLTINQTAKAAATLTTEGGGIGSLEFGLAHGDEPELLTDEQGHYVNIVGRDQYDSFAGRIDGLTSASFSMADTITATAQLARKGAHLRLRRPGRSADVRTSALPAKVGITFDPKGALTYNGNGQGIDRVTGDVHQTADIIGRAKNAVLDVRGIPADATIGFRPDLGTAGFTTTAKIDSIEAELYDAEEHRELPAGGEAGAVYRDTQDRYVVSGRVKDLRQATIELPKDKPLKATLKMAHAPFSLEYSDDEQTISGRIADVPGEINVTADLAKGDVTYDASDEIDAITLDARRPGKPYFKKAEHLYAKVSGLPKVLTFGFVPTATDGQTLVDVQATDSVDRLEVSASPDALALPDADGIRYRDTTKEWAVGARLSHFKGATLIKAPGGYRAIVDIAGSPFGIDYADDEQTLKGGIEDVPGHIDLTLDLTGGKVTYDAGAPIRRIWAEAVNPTKAYYDRAHRIHAELHGLPSHLDVGFKPVDGGPDISVQATEALGELTLSATESVTGELPLPAEDRNGVIYRDTDKEFSAGARLKGVKGFSFTDGESIIVDARLTPAPVYVDAVKDDLTLKAHLKDVPGYAKVTITPATGTYRYDADAPIDEIAAEVSTTGKLKDRIDHAKAVLRGVPAGATVTVAPATTGYGVVADRPIGSVFAGVAEGDVHDLASQGAFVRMTKDEYKASLRIDGLKEAAVNLEPLSATLEAGAGQPFTIDAAADVDKPVRPGQPDCDSDPSLCEPPDCDEDPDLCEDPPDCLIPQCLTATAAAADTPKMTATLTGTISALPGRVTLTRAVTEADQKITWDATGKIGAINLEAHNLPGDDKYYRPLNAAVTVEDVPAHWELTLPGKTGETVSFTTAGQGVGRVEAEAWQTDARWTDLPGGNAVRIADLSLERHLFARVLGVEHFSANIGKSKKAELAFRDQPQPLDLQMTSFAERIHAHIEQPPQSVTVQLPTNDTATRVTYRASAPIPSVELQAQLLLKPIIDVTIGNVPRSMDICFAKDDAPGYTPCNDASNNWFDNDQSLAFQFHANPDADPLNINGRVCLSMKPGYTNTLENCAAHPKTYAQFKNVQLRDLKFEMGSFDGDHSTVWMDSGATGINADELMYYDPDFPVKKGVVIKKFGDPMYISDFGLLIDGTVVPTIERSKGLLRCKTPGDFRAGLVEGLFPDGSADYFDLTGVVKALCPKES